MPSVDDLPEQLDPNFGGYDPDTPYQEAAQEMAYFKEGSKYGQYAPPTNDEISRFKQLKKDVESGKTVHVESVFNLAWHYEHGIDSELSNIMYGQRKPDYKEALQLYKKSYAKQYGLAAHQIGILYEKGGYGIEQDYLKASEWYLKDIEIRGDGKTIFQNIENRSSYITLARLYIEGLGVEENHAKAIEILSSLEVRGEALPGDGFPRFTDDANSNEALKYYLFSQFYTNSSGGGVLGKTYGWSSWLSKEKEDGYLISKITHEALWEKWLKRAMKLDYVPAILDYARYLNHSRWLDLDRGKPEYIEEKMKSLKDSIRSLWYYKQAYQLDNRHTLGDYNATLNNIVDEVAKAHTIVVDNIESKQNESKKVYQDIVNKALLDSPDGAYLPEPYAPIKIGTFRGYDGDGSYQHEYNIPPYPGSQSKEIKNGTWQEWYEDSFEKSEKRKILGFFDENGLEVNEKTWWYENGNKKCVIDYNHNEFGNEQTIWYENGNLARKFYTNTGLLNAGKLNGPFVEWYENGNKKIEGVYEIDSSGSVSFSYKSYNHTWTLWDDKGEILHKRYPFAEEKEDYKTQALIDSQSEMEVLNLEKKKLTIEMHDLLANKVDIGDRYNKILDMEEHLERLALNNLSIDSPMPKIVEFDDWYSSYI
jgi:TPR repeat protein